MAFDPAKVTADPAIRELIQRKARKFSRMAADPAVSPEDVEQHLLAELVRRLRGCDPGRGSPVGFALMIVAHAFADMVRDQKAVKRRCRPRRLDDCSTEDHERDHRRLKPPFESIDFALDLSEAMSELAPDLQKLAEAYFLAGTVADMARTLNVPRTTLNRRLKKLRQAFEDRGLMIYLPRHASDRPTTG
jgi:RNA polymerase sigma factor (sigma-70 family)